MMNSQNERALGIWHPDQTVSPFCFSFFNSKAVLGNKEEFLSLKIIDKTTLWSSLVPR